MPRFVLMLATVTALTAGAAPAALAQQGEVPATRPAEAASVARLVANLRDADPQVRAAARRAMLRLELADVPRIADALRGSADGAAESGGSSDVVLVVREVLDHLYLRRAKRRYHTSRDRALRDAGEDVPPEVAFLGIKLPFPTGTGGAGANGVMVVGTLVGFAAHEVLEAGDVLVELDTGSATIPLTNPDALREVVRKLPPGLEVDLRLVRGGEVLRLPFVLDRALKPGDETWPPLEAEAKRDAAEAWQTDFAPLLDRQPQADAGA